MGSGTARYANATRGHHTDRELRRGACAPKHLRQLGHWTAGRQSSGHRQQRHLQSLVRCGCEHPPAGQSDHQLVRRRERVRHRQLQRHGGTRIGGVSRKTLEQLRDVQARVGSLRSRHRLREPPRLPADVCHHRPSRATETERHSGAQSVRRGGPVHRFRRQRAVTSDHRRTGCVLSA